VAIEQPAARAGLLVEPGLVDLLVREVEDEPGALPLLSHALRTTWERREGRTLTVSGYTDGGGIRGAVAQTADAVYERLSESDQSLLRDLVLRLVVQTPSGEPVRARLSRGVIADDAPHEALVEQLVAARLVTSDDAGIELAHDAVIRAWPRLQEWIDEDAAGQRILQHLGVAANAWQQMGRPDSELYRGVRLAQAVEWRDRTTPHLTPVERGFLTAAEDLAEAERGAGCGRCLRASACSRSSPPSLGRWRSGRPLGQTPRRHEPTRAASARRRWPPTTSTARCCWPSKAGAWTTRPTRAPTC
jgi:hypothetical protein